MLSTCTVTNFKTFNHVHVNGQSSWTPACWLHSSVCPHVLAGSWRRGVYHVLPSVMMPKASVIRTRCICLKSKKIINGIDKNLTGKCVAMTSPQIAMSHRLVSAISDLTMKSWRRLDAVLDAYQTRTMLLQPLCVKSVVDSAEIAPLFARRQTYF